MKTLLPSPRLLLLSLLLFSLTLNIADSAIMKTKTRRVKASKDNGQQQKDINVCDIEQEETPLYCYCNENKLASAEDVNCLIFNRLELSNPIWAHFNSQMYIRKLSFVVRNDGSFTYIPTAVLRQLKSLNTISFQHAKLDAIEPQSFAALPSVSIINLSKNNINQLKWHAFESLRNLTVLNLDENFISELNQDIFYDVPKIQKLFLNHNNVSLLRENAFSHLPSLQELELNNNKITTIDPESFKDLRMLERLDLRNNLITMLAERSFIEMPELQELDLDQNKIKHIANYAFDGLKNLKKLRLSENNLMNLEPDFLAGAPMINLLDVRENELRTITFDNIKPIITNFYKNASFLHLDGNKLTCDCKLSWIYGLKNETRNPKLREGIDELTCYLEIGYENKFISSNNDMHRALEAVRNGFHFKSEDSYSSDNYEDYSDDYESLPIGHKTELDGKKVTLRHLMEFKPDQLPCPTREDVMASEQPSGRRDHSSSSSIFSFSTGGTSGLEHQKFVSIATVFVSIVVKVILFT